MSDQERKNRNIGLITSTGIHALILLFLFFMVAWKAPDPPLPEYGIQLNFGLDDQGSGDIQPEEVTSANDNEEDKPEEQKEEIKQDETKPEVVEKVAEQPVSKQESPVVVKEEKKETKPEPVKEKVVEKEKPLAEYKKEDKKEVKTDAKADGGKTTTSQGDDKDKTGDKGDPEGSLDAKALYGKQGGGGGNGLALSMSGWAWADPPKIPDLPDNADGRIVFEIECDADGEIVGITTVERGLSPRAEQLLKEEIRKNSLIRTSGGQAPERSKGRVVFLLKTK
jgi:periplasmic protein TonB